jgi:hypothetical protein
VSRRESNPVRRNRLRIVPAMIVGCLCFCQQAAAVGGHYVFDGGSTAQRAQVRAALDVSSFNWSLVPAQIAIHIAPGASTSAVPGGIWLDANLLDAGTFSWGVVQHEYGHEVDFFLLDENARARLLRVLGGRVWCHESAQRFAHREYGCERFASTLAWAFWPSPENCMRPSGPQDETSAMPAGDFRALVRLLLGSTGQAPGMRR